MKSLKARQEERAAREEANRRAKDRSAMANRDPNEIPDETDTVPPEGSGGAADGDKDAGKGDDKKAAKETKAAAWKPNA